MVGIFLFSIASVEEGIAMRIDSGGDTRPVLVFVDDPSVSLTDERLGQFFAGMGLTPDVNGIGCRCVEHLVSPMHRIAPILTDESRVREYSQIILLFIESTLPAYLRILEFKIAIKAFQILPDGQYSEVLLQSGVSCSGSVLVSE